MLSLVEATLENPRPILYAQTSRRRRELVAQLKAEGVDYEDRRRKADEVTYDKPEEEFITESFRIFAEHHPWVREDDVRPKSIAREMVEGWRSFHDFVKDYALARSEGLLLRYLSQVHNTLLKTVPVSARTDALLDVIAFLRALLVRVDSSLVEAWESLSKPPPESGGEAQPPRPFDLAAEERALAARVRSELHGLVHALARRDYEEALTQVREDPDWDAQRLAEALAPFHDEYGEIVFTPASRHAHHTIQKRTGPRSWDVAQVLVDPEGDGLWALHGEVDLRTERDPGGPLVRLLRIGP
jgi:hypothetical protein